MRKRRKVLVLLVCVAAAFGLIAFLSRDREPRYQGRSLSQWYVLWAKTVEGEDQQANAEAASAIRQIGTNALPTLLKRLKSQYSPWRRALFNIVGALPSAISESEVVSSFLRDADKVEPSSTFVILGGQGAQAVPELTGLMFATNNPDLARSATYCLAAIGNDGLPPLLNALAKPNLPCCYYAAYWLSVASHFNLGTNIAQAVPLLAQCTTATNEQLARAAIKALSRIKAEPRLAIPALANCLKSTNSFVRRDAVLSLAGFGTQTIPILLTALKDHDESVCRTATNCLRFLAPEVRTNSPSR